MSNKARVKKDAWASDEDAGDLLAGILDETATAASAEQQRREQERASREAAERAEAEAEAARKRAEAEAKLVAEAERQAQMQEKRTARIEAIRVEELKAKGEWVDPEIAAREAREQAAREAAQMGKPPQEAAAPTPQAVAAPVAAPAAAPKKSAAPLIALAAVFIAVIGAGAVIFGMGIGQYAPDQTSYQKVAMAPVEAEALVTMKGFEPLPEEKATVAANDSKPSKKRRSKKRRSKKKSGSKKGGIKGLDLSGDSLF